jgi:hypothetical protein
MEHKVALKLYSNRWRIKGVATTPMKKTQIDDAKTHMQSYCET